jgi:hypothetical protein
MKFLWMPKVFATTKLAPHQSNKPTTSNILKFDLQKEVHLINTSHPANQEVA